MNNKQVAHLWANQSRPEAKGSSYFFRGSTVFSYGSHFPIARHFKGAVLFTTRSYSVTTSKHISITHGACHHLPVFHVDDVMVDPCGEHVTAYRERIAAATLELSRARSGHQFKLESLTRLVNEANDFCARFKFKTRFAVPGEAQIAEVKRKADEATAKKKAASSKRQAATLAHAIRSASGDLTQLEPLTQYTFGEKDELLESRPDLQAKVAAERVRRAAVAVEDWRNGKTDNIPHNGFALLRVWHFTGEDGDSMETSQGAIVPLPEVERAFRFVIAKRSTGWHRNGDTFKVGDFHLDAVNESGIVAGCHRIAWDEVERFAKGQGWL